MSMDASIEYVLIIVLNMYYQLIKYLKFFIEDFCHFYWEVVVDICYAT